MVSACGPTLISGALSPGSNGGQVGYQLLMTRPLMNDGQGQQFMATSVAATQEQQRRMSAAQHQLSSPGSSAGHGVIMPDLIFKLSKVIKLCCYVSWINNFLQESCLLICLKDICRKFSKSMHVHAL